jgi:phosphoserine phosphatase
MDSAGVGTGKLTKGEQGGIRNGPDKLGEMKQLLGDVSRDITVYAGDSNTDLPCLLYADVGIIIGHAKSLIETCRRVGIVVKYGTSLKEIVQTKPLTKGPELILYQFDDWYGVIESGLLE